MVRNPLFRLGCTVVLFVCSLASTASAQGPWVKQIDILLGARSMSDSVPWTGLDQQGVLGVEFSSVEPNSGFGFEVGLMGSGTSTSIFGPTVDARIYEVYGGARKTFMPTEGSVHPFIGVGLSLVTAEVSSLGLSFSDSATGLYAHGGVNFDLSEVFHLGLDVRTLVGASGTIAGVAADADYIQGALVLGFSI